MSHLYSKVRVYCLAVSEYPWLSDSTAIQLVVSQAILGIRWVIIMSFMALKLKANCRTYNIAQRNARIGRIIALAYGVSSVVRYYRTFYLMSHVLK